MPRPLRNKNKAGKLVQETAGGYNSTTSETAKGQQLDIRYNMEARRLPYIVEANWQTRPEEARVRGDKLKPC